MSLVPCPAQNNLGNETPPPHNLGFQKNSGPSPPRNFHSVRRASSRRFPVTGFPCREARFENSNGPNDPALPNAARPPTWKFPSQPRSRPANRASTLGFEVPDEIGPTSARVRLCPRLCPLGCHLVNYHSMEPGNLTTERHKQKKKCRVASAQECR